MPGLHRFYRQNSVYVGDQARGRLKTCGRPIEPIISYHINAVNSNLHKPGSPVSFVMLMSMSPYLNTE